MANDFLGELLRMLRAAGSTAGNRLSTVIAFLLRYKNASTAGAIAGFAIALVCTWRYMRAAPGRRPKPSVKNDAPSSSASSSDSVSGSSSAVAARSTQPRQRGVSIQEAPSPRLTLAQSVKRQLKGGRKVTCQLLGVVLEQATAAELEKNAVVRPAATEVLFELAQSCDLYLMTRVCDDASEETVLAALDKIGLFSKSGLNRNKVLFCSSEAGRSSFVRQLEPDWHIDTSAETISQLARYIHHALFISSGPPERMASNVVEAETLESYFDCR